MVAWWRNFYSSSRESEQQHYTTSSYEEEEELHGLGDEGSATVDLYSLLGVGVMVRVHLSFTCTAIPSIREIYTSSRNEKNSSRLKNACNCVVGL